MWTLVAAAIEEPGGETDRRAVVSEAKTGSRLHAIDLQAANRRS